MTFRLKSPGSIRDKLSRRGLPATREAACETLHDIAGLRVVLSSVDRVYRFAALLRESPAAEFVSLRDYISSPKKSGYRSLHLIMRVPVQMCIRDRMHSRSNSSSWLRESCISVC